MLLEGLRETEWIGVSEAVRDFGKGKLTLHQPFTGQIQLQPPQGCCRFFVVKCLVLPCEDIGMRPGRPCQGLVIGEFEESSLQQGLASPNRSGRCLFGRRDPQEAEKELKIGEGQPSERWPRLPIMLHQIGDRLAQFLETHRGDRANFPGRFLFPPLPAEGTRRTDPDEAGIPFRRNGETISRGRRKQQRLACSRRQARATVFAYQSATLEMHPRIGLSRGGMNARSPGPFLTADAMDDDAGLFLRIEREKGAAENPHPQRTGILPVALGLHNGSGQDGMKGKMMRA